MLNLSQFLNKGISQSKSIISQSLDKGSSKSSIEKHESSMTHSTLESSSENLIGGANYGKNCYICNRGFFIRKRNLCTSCNNYVCSDHFSKMKGDYNICDFCYKKEVKNAVRIENENEIHIISFELDKTKEIGDRIHREYCQKITEVNRCEEELQKLTDLMESRKDLFIARMGNEKLRTKKNAEIMEEIKKAVEDTSINEKIISSKYDLIKQKLLEQNNEISRLKSENKELLARLDLKKRTETKNGLSPEICQSCGQSMIR